MALAHLLDRLLRRPRMLPVHYQALGQGWPACGERPTPYDSTAHRLLVTCPTCRQLLKRGMIS